jgi:hypothetical protein
VGVVADNEDEMSSYWLFAIWAQLAMIFLALCCIADALEKKNK